MFCPKCGTENKDMARFCKNCGQPLPRTARPARAPKKMPRLVGILALAMVCVVVAILVYPRLESMPLPGGTGLPRDIERIIFEESRFAEPVTVLGGGFNKALHNFLLENGYAETITVREGYGGYFEFERLFYTEALKPYILSGTYTSELWKVLLATRKLKRISFTNQYTQFGEKFYAVKFTYTLDEVLPGLSDIKKEFEGKAELYWDPSEGTWTLQHVQLEDRGYSEYFEY